MVRTVVCNYYPTNMKFHYKRQLARPRCHSFVNQQRTRQELISPPISCFTVLSRPYALKPTAGQSKIFVLLLKIICVNYVKPGKHICEDHFHLYSLSTVHSYDLYHIHIKVNQAGSHLKAIQIRRTCNEFVEWSLLFSLYFFQFFYIIHLFTKHIFCIHCPCENSFEDLPEMLQILQRLICTLEFISFCIYIINPSTLFCRSSLKLS